VSLRSVDASLGLAQLVEIASRAYAGPAEPWLANLSQIEPPVSGFGGWRIGRLAQAILRLSQVFEGVRDRHYLATFTVARLGQARRGAVMTITEALPASMLRIVESVVVRQWRSGHANHFQQCLLSGHNGHRAGTSMRR
jgi:hypothetical protein